MCSRRARSRKASANGGVQQSICSPASVWSVSSVRWSWPPSLVIILLVLTETLCLAAVSTATRMHYIHWNTTNPIFRIDNTDHIIDVNKNNIPFEYDQVNIICPVYTPGTHEDDAEKYIIYNVSKEEYDTCRITNPNPRIIAVCDKPYKLMYFTITFRSFTPQPGGLEFRPGQDYYFISTSSRDDLHRRIGGRCSSHNMKVVFKVCCKPEDMDKMSPARSTLPPPASNSSTAIAAPSTPAALPPRPVSVSPLPPVVAPPSPTPSPLPVPPPSVPSSSVPPRLASWKEPDVQSYSVRTTTKKNDEADRLSNEVVKNEELSSKGAGTNPQSGGVKPSGTLWLGVVTWLVVSFTCLRYR